MKDPTELPGSGDDTRRIQAVVALRLLEVIRDRDLPGEILEDEDPTRTMPRRFGLSDVVERQIRTYKADVRKRTRLTDAEVGDLFRLVIRRPDGDEIFEQAGRLLAEVDRSHRLSRVLPKRASFAIARSAAKRRLKKLFGRTIGGFGRGPFVIEGRSLFFIRHDPGGDACHLLSGFCKEVIEQRLGGTVRVDHTQCQARGDELCRWEAEVVEESASLVGPALSPEAEAGA
ncbi:MAG: 4-vinyl reductase [Gemmatimonadota bacterium]